jgi:hypothetical protein
LARESDADICGHLSLLVLSQHCEPKVAHNVVKPGDLPTNK